jgi:hypothetical protein
MPVATIRAALVAAPAVTAICSDRIVPLNKAQGELLPAVTLQRTQTDPFNHLRGHGGLDNVRVQLDAWDETYDGAKALADACKDALNAAGHLMNAEFDNYEPEPLDPGLYRVTQEWSVLI